jgi:hypothetical protein
MEDKRCSLTILKTIWLYLRSPQVAFEIEKREWGLLLARRKLQRRGLAQMYGKLHPVSYQPDWSDLLNIYELGRRRRPKIVIEFGSGCSTLMFAKALADNGSGHLYSIETSEHFKKRTESYLPASLRPFVELIHSDIEFGQMAGEKVMWHRTIPDVSPNLVYIDGPDYQDFSADVEIQADGVMLEPKAQLDYTILIDGRKQTFEFTRRNLRRNYKTTKNIIDKWELLEALPQLG